ncbi:heat shock [Colletotrichum liriopes]|uniref:Heat shock n=1 Tax=Colletotrichum liriopes TaxID=708192 RepID=A0AA37H1A7_9PEZI|nr:heat shock [Colletotrichum liriopes]
MANLGIDLGTTFTCAFIAGQDGNLEVLELCHGNRITRSVVQITKGKWSLKRPEDLASQQRKHIAHTKRLIGRTRQDGQLEGDIPKVDHARLLDEYPFFEVGNGKILPEEISAFILARVRQLANTRTGTELTGCVLAVPAYFTHQQREVTRDAAEIAGFQRHHVKLVPEPVAALVAHFYGDGQKNESAQEGEWFVIDIGGGTADVTVAYVEKMGTRRSFVVNATAGDNSLGGVNFDEALIDLVLRDPKLVGPYAKLDPSQCNKVRLRASCERAKEELSQATFSTITVEDDEGEEVDVNISRDQAQDAWQHIIEKIRELFRDALRLAKTSEIGNVLVAGGTGNMPCVRSIIQEMLPAAIIHHSHLSEAVAQGAARISADTNISITEVTPRAIGILLTEGNFGEIVSRNQALPLWKKAVFSTPQDDCESLHIALYEGETSEATRNIHLGDFYVMDIPPCPADTPVTVDIKMDRLGEITATASLDCLSESLHIDYKPRHSQAELRELRRLNYQRLDGTVTAQAGQSSLSCQQRDVQVGEKRPLSNEETREGTIIPIKRNRRHAVIEDDSDSQEE